MPSLLVNYKVSPKSDIRRGMKKILLLLSAVFLVGCDNSHNAQELGWRFTTDAVKEVTLKDGTNCAVYQGMHGGGISCNWR